MKCNDVSGGTRVISHKSFCGIIIVSVLATFLVACGGGGTSASSGTAAGTSSASSSVASSISSSSSSASSVSSSSKSSASSSSSSSSVSSASSSSVANSSSSSSSKSSSSSSSSKSSSSSSSSQASSSSSSQSSTITGKLGKPNRILIGLGGLSEPNYTTTLQAQGVNASIVHNPDIVDQYLPDYGYGTSNTSYWVDYNMPTGSYVLDVAQDADAVGAVPMFTLYQMAQAGDGNISWINTSSQMDIYWSHVRILFQMIHQFGKPVLVNLEPDFWGYVELQVLNSGNDPSTIAASVNDQSECATLPNTVTGLAACILAMRNTYAPNALVGFQPSFFGEDAPTLAFFMNKLGAQNADFTVAETLDRDAGCYEEAQIQKTDTANIHAATIPCTRTGSFYLDETNKTTPNFNQEVGQWTTYRNDLGGMLPVIWWQTPLGVPSSTPGGTDGHYRDNHVDYMFNNMSQYAAMGTFGIVFSGGASYQTDITTDSGEFATLFDQYLGAGGVVPLLLPPGTFTEFSSDPLVY